MSRFYASISGGRGEVTRSGHRSISGHIRGWDRGVRVEGSVDDDGNDIFRVYVTSGSGGDKKDDLVMRIFKDGSNEYDRPWRIGIVPG